VQSNFPVIAADGELDDPVVLLEYYNRLVDQVKSLSSMSNLSIFDGTILEDIVIPSGEEVIIAHKLGFQPKYRIILRNTGDSDIVDGSTWDDSRVSFINNGSTEAKISVLILKE